MDTTALILSYIALEIGLYQYGQYDLFGVLISLFGLILTGEYFAIKRTGKTISKNFSNTMP